MAWREKELSIKNDIADVFRRSLAVADSKASHLDAEIQQKFDEIKGIKVKLEEASREPGRKLYAVCSDAESSAVFVL